MTNYDLPAALKNYRLEHKLSLSQMGKKLNMSKSAYNRLEKGIRKPYHDELVNIIQKLGLDVDPGDIASIPKPEPRWYQSNKMRWLLPIAIANVFTGLLLEIRGFREAYSEEALEAGAPLKAMFIFGALICAFSWYFWTPEWPKRKPTTREVVYGFAAIIIYLLVFFFDELSRIAFKWIAPYLRDVTAGPWLVFVLISALLSLVLWNHKKTMVLSIRNMLTKR